MFTVGCARGAGPLLRFEHFLTLLLALLHFPLSQKPPLCPSSSGLARLQLFVDSPLVSPVNLLSDLQFSCEKLSAPETPFQTNALGTAANWGKKQTAITSTMYLSVSLSLRPALHNFPEKNPGMLSCGIGKRRELCSAKGLGVSHAQSCFGGHFSTVGGRQNSQRLFYWCSHA